MRQSTLRETPFLDQRLRDLVAENAVELSATVTLDQPLRWWLRAFGSQVQVLAPVSLREEMRADAEAAARDMLIMTTHELIVLDAHSVERMNRVELSWRFAVIYFLSVIDPPIWHRVVAR